MWFDGGHSDSMDPDTFSEPILSKFGKNDNSVSKDVDVADESSTVGTILKDWNYIRVDGLAYLPGLVCPLARSRVRPDVAATTG